MKVEYVTVAENDAWEIVEAGATKASRWLVGHCVFVTGLREGEPVFVLRGQDAAAMAMLNLYRTITEGLFEGERALALEADVQAFVDWRRANQLVVKDPD